ncbi:hypothetical protein DSO57_1027087 [Entomophthora muscae]|uniref:Uncharacterized protein n=1 Tax=Entomophthora muscae TaxID=34485 RepID=A0ACC2T1Y1_9FUNG|nr:hypothetical protein DSO57_1027087 [Entomophthora muscae]
MYHELTLSFNVFFFVAGMMGIAFNILLIYIALNIQARRREINYAVGLALVDMILPVLAVMDSIFYFSANLSIKGNPVACTIQGPLHFFLPVLSMTIVCIIALERHSAVFGMQLWRRTHSFLASLCGIFFIVNLLLSAFVGYDTGKSGIRCNPLPHAFLPQIMSIMLFLMLTALLITTLVCYLRILNYATQVNMEAKLLRSSPHHRQRRLLLIRIGTTSLIYFLIISPTCILIPVEAFAPDSAREAICIAIYFTLFLISVANPCLILLAHSTFYHRLCSLLNIKT